MSGLWASGDVISMARMNQKTLFMGTAAPATTYAGQVWYDTQTEQQKVRNAANTAWLFLTTTLIQALSVVTVTAQTAETAFTNLVYNFGANGLVAGQSIELEAWGSEISSGTPSTITIVLRWGAVTTGTLLLSTGAITPTASLTADAVHIHIIIHVIDATHFEAQGTVEMNPSTAQTEPLREYSMNSAATKGTVPNVATVVFSQAGATNLTLACVFGATTAGNSLAIRAGYVRIC